MEKLICLFAMPFIFALGAFLFPLKNNQRFKGFAFCASLIPLLFLLFHHESWRGVDIKYPWMPALSVDFHLSVDSLSLVFLYLTALIIPLSILTVQTEGLQSANALFGLIFLLQGLLFGFFTAQDLALFTFFWESMLIPVYLIISLWGGKNRQAAALKFLIYMIAGSCLMVAAVLLLFFSSPAGTFNIEVLAKTAESLPHSVVIFVIFLLAFSVKTPLFPFHAWLPDAYYQASTTGTILLAAILSKAGIYGILRIGLGFFPHHMISFGPYLLGIAIIGVLYGGLAAWRQRDFKHLVAYSSFSHVNFILAGLFVFSEVAHEGAILQAFNHGITITALFISVSWLEQRLGTNVIGTYQGLATYMPRMCWITLIFVLSSVALPGTNNFVGEILILFGIFKVSPFWAATLGLSVILSVIYMLRWMQKVYFERPSPFDPAWVDLKPKEMLVALPLIILIFWIGVYPSVLLNEIEPAAQKISSLVVPKELKND